MASHEQLGGEKLQDQNRLRSISETAHAWLEGNSSIQELPPGTTIVGSHIFDGLPMVEGLDMPRLEYELPGEAVWAISPMAADVLALDGSVTLISWLPHHQKQSGGSWAQAEDRGREFIFNKRVGDSVVRETLCVRTDPGIDETGGFAVVFSGDRMTEYYENGVMDRERFQLNDMTFMECWALQTIIDNADDIRDYKPESVEPAAA